MVQLSSRLINHASTELADAARVPKVAPDETSLLNDPEIMAIEPDFTQTNLSPYLTVRSSYVHARHATHALSVHAGRHV